MCWIQGHVFGSRYAEQSQILHHQWNGSPGPLKLHYKNIILMNNADLVFLLINIFFLLTILTFQQLTSFRNTLKWYKGFFAWTWILGEYVLKQDDISFCYLGI